MTAPAIAFASRARRANGSVHSVVSVVVVMGFLLGARCLLIEKLSCCLPIENHSSWLAFNLVGGGLSHQFLLNTEWVFASTPKIYNVVLILTHPWHISLHSPGVVCSYQDLIKSSTSQTTGGGLRTAHYRSDFL